ncbi:TPA: 50S ribosomal protein L17 [Candidatus Saccharibacteria bacterium]|nr:MAG: 50S ribosomal protein L17 [Candidatus Saccharibacteria bacterium GW2011_GWA2_46_10]OGL35549.1 MAG: 50S ribosomal protein L17 [Candidatus Saccharibacteria bacterium RIFCSPHIGHO2_12_FULL_47_17]HCM51837.1 50S ribosomal protein L17 [Candidatus Saccharibacteria bacterium]
MRAKAKFGRERDGRRALIKLLADSLIINESVQTTLPKAKQLVSYTERLITRAKKGDLHSRRLIIRSLATKDAAHKLVDEISPKLGGRSSGYFRIIKAETRRGDLAQLAKVSFVDNLTEIKAPKAEKKATAAKVASKKTVAKVVKKPAAKTKLKTKALK